MTGIVLLVLVAAAIAGLVWTRDPGPPAAVEEGAAGHGARKKNAPPPRERLVDTRPLLTARRMAALATSLEEQAFARQVERLADHAVDLAFAEMMRRAADNPPEATPEIKELAALKERAQAALETNRQRVRQITQQLAAAREREKERLQNQLEVAKAQVELAQDELNDAAENLQRAGGDPQAKIARLKEVYEAAQKEPRPAPAPVTDGSSPRAGSLLARFRGWTWQRTKLAQLAQARQEALEKAQRMTGRRATLVQQQQQETEAREAAKRSAARVGHGGAEGGRSSKEEAQAALTSLRRFSDNQRRLSIVARLIQDEEDLGEVYASWIALVKTHARAALHQVIQGLLWVLATLLLVFLGSRLVDRLFLGMAQEKVRMRTLRTVVKFAVQLLGALVLLFILFGMPSQVTTIVGLAGAGLTVAMKDFIVAFFGWFLLMGRNGIRVGDWVEIKGVGGEVAEIGLLHTVLLETGNWSDAGHPTGRRVSFVNSFAIEGHYFNFSTSGQWMWDELRVVIPLGQDPYPTIDGVQKLVERETEANAKLAEQEWRKSTTRYRVQTFSAVPGINVVPTSGGIEIVVRYITRAHERHETRRRLNHAVVELLHGKRNEARGAGTA